MAHWMGSGWDSMDSAYENVFSNKDKGPRRVWMPAGEERRVLFLDDSPETQWEHSYKWNNRWDNYEPCIVYNKLGGVCPICEAYRESNKFPYFTGLCTVINMTPWFTKKTNREINFRREIFAPKLGSKDNPGVLKKLRKLYDKNGGLRGFIYDVSRPGKKTEVCGSDFEFVEKIEPSKIKAYGMDQLNDYAKRLNEKAPKDKQVTPEQLWEENPWEPLDFKEVIKRHTIEELTSMFSRTGGAAIDNEGSKGSEGYADSEGDGLDDDIPY